MVLPGSWTGFHQTRNSQQHSMRNQRPVPFTARPAQDVVVASAQTDPIAANAQRTTSSVPIRRPSSCRAINRSLPSLPPAGDSPSRLADLYGERRWRKRATSGSIRRAERQSQDRCLRDPTTDSGRSRKFHEAEVLVAGLVVAGDGGAVALEASGPTHPGHEPEPSCSNSAKTYGNVGIRGSRTRAAGAPGRSRPPRPARSPGRVAHREAPCGSRCSRRTRPLPRRPGRVVLMRPAKARLARLPDAKVQREPVDGPGSTSPRKRSYGPREGAFRPSRGAPLSSVYRESASVGHAGGEVPSVFLLGESGLGQSVTSFVVECLQVE